MGADEIDYSIVRIPLFPLPAVIFPGEAFPLHVFEPRFKELVADVLSDRTKTRVFGVSMAENGTLRPIGCAVRIERIQRTYEGGELDVVTVGERRYEMLELYRQRSYPEIQVKYFDDLSLPGHPLQLEKAVSLHARLVELVKGRPPPMHYPEGAANSFILAHEAGLDVAQRQTLLELRREEQRLDYLIAYYQQTLPILAEQEEIQERIRANGFFRRMPGAKIDE